MKFLRYEEESGERVAIFAMCRFGEEVEEKWSKQVLKDYVKRMKDWNIPDAPVHLLEPVLEDF